MRLHQVVLRRNGEGNMGKGTASGRHQLAAASEYGRGWQIAKPAGRTVLFSTEESRTLDVAELMTVEAIRNQGGRLTVVPLERRRVESREQLEELRREHNADQAVLIVAASAAGRFGVAPVDPLLSEGVAISATAESFAAHPVTPDVPLIFADGYGPYFVAHLMSGEIRPPDHETFAKIAWHADFAAAFERLVKTVAPAGQRAALLAKASDGELRPIDLSDLLSGMFSDPKPRFAAKSAFVETVLRIARETA